MPNPEIAFPAQQRVIGPISPNQAKESLNTIIPQEVYDAVNALLIKQSHSGSIHISQPKLVESIINSFTAAGKKIDSHTIYGNHWLDFEDAYRKQGWVVTYDKPAYNETYDASWDFSTTPKRRSTD